MDYYIIAGIVVFIIIIFVVIISRTKKENKKVEPIACKNNDIKIIKNDNSKKTPLYYIRYKGTVKLGIDFSDIGINIDNEKKIIDISVPEAVTLECNVNGGEMDAIYIDNKEKKNEENNFIKNGIEICSKDMEEKISNDEVMLDIARKNTKQAIEALVSPFVKQMDSDYKIIISDKEDIDNEEN